MAEATSRTAVERARRSPRVFFGWWIIAAGAGLQMMQAMFLGQAYGAYVVLLRDEFGWSKTMLSAASSLREAESGILGPAQGWLLDRIGPRAVARIGVVVMGIGFMLFSQVNTPLTFYGAFLVMSVGGSMAGYMTVTFAAVHWFERRRATAISLTSAGFALGGMLTCQRGFLPVLRAKLPFAKNAPCASRASGRWRARVPRMRRFCSSARDRGFMKTSRGVRLWARRAGFWINCWSKPG